MHVSDEQMAENACRERIIDRELVPLRQYGWGPRHEEHWRACGRADWIPGRVLSDHRHLYTVMTEWGELRAEVSGRFRASSLGTGGFPAVGDWVLLEPRLKEGAGTVQFLLPRLSHFSRKSAGARTDEQVMAANFDTVLLVMSLNQDFNLRRLERYLVMAWDSGATPVVVLTKKDVCPIPHSYVEKTEAIAQGVPVLAVSAMSGDGMAQLEPWLIPEKTLVVLGSSGAGKSTLMNRLAGQELAATQQIREDDARGRHTTTHRELYRLDSGVLVLDTPGIRELQLWESDGGVEEAFSDIRQLAAGCRFRDCTHNSEPGCAIQDAIMSGILAAERYDSYVKLSREMRHVTEKNTHALREAQRAFGRSVTKMQRERKKTRFDPKGDNHMSTFTAIPSLSFSSPLVSDLPKLAAMVAARVRAQRKAVPVLPERYTTVESVLPRLEDLCGKTEVLVLRERERPVGFLGGWHIPQFMGDRDGIFVPEIGFGTDTLQPDRVCGVFEQLYNRQCGSWCRAGALNHAIFTYEQERALRDELFHGGFGGVCMDAIRPAVALRLPVPEDIQVREVTAMDESAMKAWKTLCRLHHDYMVAAPVLLGSSEAMTDASLLEWIESKARHAWIVEDRSGEALAYLQMEEKTDGTSMLVEDAASNRAITGAFTLPKARGRGLASLLLDAALTRAAADGMASVSVDFESRNRPAARFWTRHFAPFTFSVLRQVDARAL